MILFTQAKKENMALTEWYMLTFEERHRIEVEHLTARLEHLDEQIDVRHKALSVMRNTRSDVRDALDRLRAIAKPSSTPDPVAPGATMCACGTPKVFIKPKYQEGRRVCPTCLYELIHPRMPSSLTPPAHPDAAVHPDAAKPEKLVDVFRKYEFPCMHLNNPTHPDTKC